MKKDSDRDRDRRGEEGQRQGQEGSRRTGTWTGTRDEEAQGQEG
jgi:hypothetical protein